MALALRPRVEALAWRLMPKALEKAFDALALEGMHLSLARLDLDLGRVRPDHLEDDALAALAQALAEALRTALREAQSNPSEALRLIAPPALRLEQLETYLVLGLGPSQCGADFEAATRLVELVEEQPADLIAMLRRHAGRRHVLERLVLQAGEAGLRRLLAALTPAEAAVILALLEDVILAHRVQPLATRLRLEEPRLRRLVWIASLTFLLRDAGTRFNRRRFLASLLQDEAARAGVDYLDLLRLLDEAVESLKVRGGLRSELAALLAEILAEQAPVLAAAVDGGEPSRAPVEIDARDDEAAAFEAAAAGDFEQLLNLFRRRLQHRPGAAALAAKLTDALFAGLVRYLAPADAGEVLADLEALIELQRREGVSTRSPAGFARLIRFLTLDRLVRDRSGRLGRAARLRRLLTDIAAEDDVPYAALLQALVRAMARAGGRPWAAWPDLAAELAEAREAASQTAPEERGRPSPSVDPRDLAQRLGEADAAVAAELLHRLAPDAALLSRVVAASPKARWGRLVAALDPVNAPGVMAELRAVWRLQASERLAALDGADFERLTVTLALAYLVDRRGARFDRRALWRRLLDGIARHDGASGERFAGGLQSWLARTAERQTKRSARRPTKRPGSPLEMIDQWARARLDQTAADPPGDLALERIERFLRTGQPTMAWRDLAAAATGQPNGLSALLRRLVRDAPEAVPVLAGRLLDGLTPEEVMELVAPDLTTRAMSWAEGLDAGAAAVWREVVANLLAGRTPDFTPTSGKARLDRLAQIAHWLDHGGEAPPQLARVAHLSRAELVELFLVQGRDHAPGRLLRTTEALGPRGGTALLRRLAPWAVEPAGPLAAMLAGLSETQRQDARLRAVAAALEDGELDLQDLLRDEAPALSPSAAAAAADPGIMTTARLYAWLDGADATSAQAAALVREFVRRIDAGDAELTAYLKTHRARPRAQARWATILTPAALGRVVKVLVPARARAIQDAAMLIGAAWRQTAARSGRRIAGDEIWRAVLALIGEPREISLAAVVEGVIGKLAAGDAAQAAGLRARAARLAEEGGYVSVKAQLNRPPPRRPTRLASPKVREPEPPPPSEPDQPIYIGNAGLVLLGPYLPALFNRLDLLTTGEDGAPRIVGVEALSRAAHLLQYLVDGRLDAPEPELALNKLLCGAAIAQPIAPRITPDPTDLEQCDGLLKAVIANWPRLGQSSLAALRETFLQREGRLLRVDTGWGLTVQRRAVDVLTDQVPWSFSMIYHRWMADPIHVTW